MTVVSAPQKEIIDAIKKVEFKDFEDCLQDKCAKESHCDYIVTANIKDFEDSEIKAVLPDEFLKIVKLKEQKLKVAV